MTREPRSKKPTRSTKRGPKETQAEPQRVARHALAAMLGVHKSTVYDLLTKQDAPRPDAAMRYATEETLTYLKSRIGNSTQGGDPQVINLKAEKLSLEVARLKREEEARAGRLVALDRVQDEVAGVIAEQDRLLRSLFIDELPSKYAGKTLEERRQLNEDAIERFVAAFKAGADSIAPAPTEPRAA